MVVSVLHHLVSINRVNYIKDDDILERGPETEISFVQILRTVKFRTATLVIDFKPVWQFTNYFRVGKDSLLGIRTHTVRIHDSVKESHLMCDDYLALVLFKDGVAYFHRLLLVTGS